MEFVRSITEEEALRNISPGPAPRGMAQVNWARSRPEGRREGKGIAWHRGHMAGVWDSVLTLRKAGNVRVADALRKAYGMNEHGDIEL